MHDPVWYRKNILYTEHGRPTTNCLFVEKAVRRIRLRKRKPTKGVDSGCHLEAAE